jgi:hypothetical protein
LRDLITLVVAMAHKDHYLMALDDQCLRPRNTMYLFKDDPNVPSSLLCRRKAKIVPKIGIPSISLIQLMPPLTTFTIPFSSLSNLAKLRRILARDMYISACADGCPRQFLVPRENGMRCLGFAYGIPRGLDTASTPSSCTRT